MKLEDIQKEWESDATINQLDLAGESLKTSRLHQKYYKIFVAERATLIIMIHQLKSMELTKLELYTEGPHSEIPQTWKNQTGAAKGRILKTAVQPYLDADEDLIDFRIRLEIQKEKANFVESIIKGLRDRGFAIKNAIDMVRFQHGQ